VFLRLLAVTLLTQLDLVPQGEAPGAALARLDGGVDGWELVKGDLVTNVTVSREVIATEFTGAWVSWYGTKEEERRWARRNIVLEDFARELADPKRVPGRLAGLPENVANHALRLVVPRDQCQFDTSNRVLTCESAEVTAELLSERGELEWSRSGLVGHVKLSRHREQRLDAVVPLRADRRSPGKAQPTTKAHPTTKESVDVFWRAHLVLASPEGSSELPILRYHGLISYVTDE
jgi:hypothetical protein